MARILLGVSGGIAAYKALELARLATKAGHGVRVVMTPAAQRFIGAASVEGIVGGHLEVVQNADALLVAPASANTVAKLAAGICDSMLTTAFLACTAPRAVAP